MLIILEGAKESLPEQTLLSYIIIYQKNMLLPPSQISESPRIFLFLFFFSEMADIQRNCPVLHFHDSLATECHPYQSWLHARAKGVYVI